MSKDVDTYIYIEPYKVCEYSKFCKNYCIGKDEKRSTMLSCARRRFLLRLQLSHKKEGE